jgi:hypothetical protein
MSDAPEHSQVPLSASERLAAALGRHPARKLSETELRDFERRQDEVDAQIERLYGSPRAA